MGIDGRLRKGDGIWLNCNHLPPEWVKYLKHIWYKFPNLFDVNAMNGVDNRSTIVFWGEELEVLFPVGTSQRRPLIINEPEQTKLMKPYDPSSGKSEWDMGVSEGVILEEQKIWEPSFGDFEIRLNDYRDKEAEKRDRILKYFVSQEYELGEEHSKFYGDKSYLTQEEVDMIVMILSTPGYSLVGQWLVYIAD